MAAKERHEDLGKRQKTFIKGFQRGFTAHGIANEHRDKVNHVVEAKSGASKPHSLLDGFEHPKRGEHMSQNGHLTKPGGSGGNGFGVSSQFFGAGEKNR